MNLLHLDAGITGDASVTREVSAAVVEGFRRADPTLQIVRRDLARFPIPHLDGRDLAGLGDSEILTEFLRADVVVIGAPMYNFGLPTQLKAWFDRVLVAGRTFRYSQAGPEGLAGDKLVVVASSRGGVHLPAGQPGSLDFQEAHLAAMLGFIGVSDVTTVRAEGVALGAEAREAAVREALSAAQAVADRLVGSLAA